VVLLRWLGALFTGLVGLILPVFQQARASAGLGRAVRIVLHVVVVVAIVVGLYFLNNYLRLDALIRGPSRFLARSWLPILFLLIYTLCWLSWWLWKLLVSEEEVSHFPDIDAAWQEALAGLRSAGLGLTDLPLFLILGRPEDDERTLFQGAGLRLVAGPLPARSDAPLHFYAGPDGLYLTCAGASLLGCFAASLAPRESGRDSPEMPAGGEDEDEVIKTLSPSSARSLDAKRVVQDMADVLRQAEREHRALTKVEKRELRAIYRRDNRHRSVLRNAGLVDEQSARLLHLCRLLVRDRQPFCAVNGILLLVPFAGSDSDEDAVQTGTACQRDLAVTARALKVHCPLFALVCDLETAPGFAEFIDRFTPRERLQRLGRSCPLAPDFRDLTPAEGSPGPTNRLAQSLADWLCQSVVQSFVYRKFQGEKTEDFDELAGVVADNARLFLFFDELHERSRRLGRILGDALATRASADPLLFGGCYLAGTGTDAGREQAFVKGLFDRLEEAQSAVSWTEEARAEDAQYARWVNTGWAALAVLVLLTLAVAGYGLYFGKDSS
jgi:hypothetical protein